MSFSNLEKAFSSAKVVSKNWFSNVSQVSVEEEINDLLTNFAWPTPKKESWKYTNISKLSKLDFHSKEQISPQFLPSPWKDFLADFETSFVFWNGEFSLKLSRASKSIQYEFSRASENKVFCELSGISEFEKINNVLLKDLYSIEIKKNEKINKPVVFLFLSSSDLARPQIHSSRLIIRMGDFSEASVFEIHAGLTEIPDQIENHITEAHLGESAHLEHNFLNVTSTGSHNFFFKKYEQSKNSLLRTLHIDLGGDLSRTETLVNLNGSASEAFVNGLYLNEKKQHTDHLGVIRHVAPETLSHQLFKGILTDQSRAIFNAKVRIEKSAPKSNAQQLNKNLLMSNKAEVDSLPRLEIFNDDVKATHGSASGQLDQSQIFYLISRAISRPQAVQMLVEGYAVEMLNGVESLVAGKVLGLIAEKLERFKSEEIK